MIRKNVFTIFFMLLFYLASFTSWFTSAFRLCFLPLCLVAPDLCSRSIVHNASACTRVEFLWSGISHSFIPFAYDFTTDVFIRIHTAPPRAFLIVSEMQHDGCNEHTHESIQHFLNSFVSLIFQLNKHMFLYNGNIIKFQKINRKY